MSLATQITALATRVATEIKAVRAEMTGNIDGGKASTTYGSSTTINGGNASGV